LGWLRQTGSYPADQGWESPDYAPEKSENAQNLTDRPAIDSMKFDTYIPCDILKPYVKAFAIAETTEEKTYKVLPDTGLIICFQYKINHSHFYNVNQFLVNSSGLTGLQDSYRIYKNPTDIGAILIRFKEGGAAAFFRQPIHEFFGDSILLDNFMLRSELQLLEEQLCETRTDIEKIKVVEQFLISRISHASKDNLVLKALTLIHNSKGNIRIKDLMEQLYISQSSLEKRFRQIIGASPKKFASIVRFKHIIQNYNPQTSLSDLGYDAGFYDQSHFIKEFKCFTGETPETFFNKI
jgi:AraC-like DNA-binding protein